MPVFGKDQAHMRKSFFAFPQRIFALSSSHSGTLSIQRVPGGLGTNGQSIANKMRSMPISITQQSNAGLEKLPDVVIQKLLQKTSRKLNCLLLPGRASALSMRH